MSDTKTLAVVFFFGLVAAASAQSCGLCDEMELQSTGGIDDELGRYTGGWVKQGDWEGRPFYTCPETGQGLRDNLVSICQLFHFGYLILGFLDLLRWRVAHCGLQA